MVAAKVVAGVVAGVVITVIAIWTDTEKDMDR